MELWIRAQSLLEIVIAFSCVAVAVVLFNSLRTRHRSTITKVLALFGFLVLAIALLGVMEAAGSTWLAIRAKLALTAALTIMVVAISTTLIRSIPWAVAFQDQSYYRAAAEELRECKERFQRAINGSFGGLWEWNIDAHTVWFSSHFRELIGYETDNEFPNKLKSWRSSLHPADSRNVLDALNRRLRDQGSYDVECRLRMKSGEYRWFNARGLAICRPDGQLYLMSGAIHDIDDRKRAEEALRRRDDYLSQKQKMEALGELAGETAHEFNNLLQAISGQIQFADRCLPERCPAKQELANATDLIEQSVTFTRQLLDFSRRSQSEVQAVNPNKVVTQLAAVLRPILGDRVVLQVRLGKRGGRVLAHPTALQQALLNLCMNARDAMPEGGNLIVRTQRSWISPNEAARYPGAIPGLYMKLSVADTGCGLTKDAKARCFEPFFTTKSMGKGTGLGLAVVYSVVKECRGFVDVSSSPGHGATFTIWIPISKSKGHSRAASPGSSTNGEIRHRATVLCVEDQASIHGSTAKLLEKHGHKVIAASNGNEAMQLFSEHLPKLDAAILDVDMPEHAR